MRYTSKGRTFSYKTRSLKTLFGFIEKLRVILKLYYLSFHSFPRTLILILKSLGLFVTSLKPTSHTSTPTSTLPS